MKRMMLNWGRLLSGISLAGVCVLGAGCGGQEADSDDLSGGAEEALLPAGVLGVGQPGVNSAAAAWLSFRSAPPVQTQKQDLAKDISPDPIPARDPSGSVPGTGKTDSSTGQNSTDVEVAGAQANTSGANR